MTKKEICKIILFLGIFLFILQTVTYMIRTNGAVKDRFMGFYAEKNNSLDVVLLGSSPVPSCYAAPLLWGEYGIKAYPVSSNLQRPKATWPLIEEIRKTQEPSLYIVELRQFTATDDSMTENMAYTRGVTDNMKYSLNRIKTINDLVADPKERYQYYFDIFKYHSNWKTIVLPEQIASFQYERLHPLKGYDISDKVGPSKIVDYSGTEGMMAIPPEQEEVLCQLLENCNKANIEVLFLVSPYTMTEEKQKMYNYMEDIIKQYDYKILNLNDYYQETKIDFQTDFYDYGGHTNAAGAYKCTQFLGKYLLEHYEIGLKNDSNSNTSWDESYQAWKKQYAKAVETINLRVAQKDYTVMEDE